MDNQVIVKPSLYDLPDEVLLPLMITLNDTTLLNMTRVCKRFKAIAKEAFMKNIKTGHLLSLSEQNLVDCSQSYENLGCNGGLAVDAFKYITDHGIDAETSYPYSGTELSVYNLNAKKSNVTVKGFVRIPSGNEEEMQKALAFHGPVAASIDASHDSFDHISHDIYHEPACSSTNLDHLVLVVGYGTDHYNRDYYIVKNSWGTTWGEMDYFRISRNQMNHCGIATRAVIPII
ncbi:cathepsin L-like [Sitodiplosis mosellana]|uniref:cathepsin L-like n=1 Tax=Sitodiplosis mosellana TaxID=263140 RepID=UPI002444039C|nr:cathepsin L-like [Sitodiplosis mosellana]